MAARRTSSEWEMIKLEYLASDDSIREIADRYAISEAAIRKRAKAEGWKRPVRTREPARTLMPTPRLAPAAEAEPRKPVEVAAIAEQARQLVGRMLDELDAVTSYLGELEIAIEEATAEDDSDRRRDSLLKSISLPQRSAIAKNLATALKTINESSAPQGKKAAAQERASAVGRRFGTIGPPTAPTKTLN